MSSKNKATPSPRIDSWSNQASVLDVLASLLGTKTAAVRGWTALTNDHTQCAITRKVVDMQINGTGDVTCVAPFETLVEIVFAVPGASGHARRAVATSLVALLNGDRAVVTTAVAKYATSTRAALATEMKAENARVHLQLRCAAAETGLKEAKLRRAIVETRAMEMAGIREYHSLLTDAGLHTPSTKAIVLDAVANVFVAPAPVMCTLAAYMKLFTPDLGNESLSVVGRVVAQTFRFQFNREPATTVVMARTGPREVKLYQRTWLARCMEQLYAAYE